MRAQPDSEARHECPILSLWGGRKSPGACCCRLSARRSLHLRGWQTSAPPPAGSSTFPFFFFVFFVSFIFVFSLSFSLHFSFPFSFSFSFLFLSFTFLSPQPPSPELAQFFPTATPQTPQPLQASEGFTRGFGLRGYCKGVAAGLAKA